MAPNPAKATVNSTDKSDRKEGPFHSLKRWLLSLGPGIIIAALVFGPSKMTITSKLGAEYGYALLWIIVVAIVGTFYQSYLVQERLKNNPQGKQVRNDSFTGIILLGVMSAIVMICAAAVLHPKGIKAASASDMARALEPLFGSYASVLFLPVCLVLLSLPS